MSTANNYNEVNTLYDVVSNISKASAYNVPARDRHQHEQCVFFALDNMHVGESCDWYSNTSDARGSTKIVAHTPISNGYCTILFNSVVYKGSTKNWRETACKKGASQWRFY